MEDQLATEASPSRRPVLVSVIFWLYAFATFSLAWLLLRSVSRGGMSRILIHPFVIGATTGLMALRMAAAAALYKLRGVAVSLFLAALLLNLPLTTYDIYRHVNGYAASSRVAMLFGLAINVGVCVYVVRLRRQGVLNDRVRPRTSEERAHPPARENAK